MDLMLDEYEDEAEEDENKALSDIDTLPTSGMVSEAKKGLAWRKEFGRGGTMVGLARANSIVAREKLSESTVKRMYSFFSRHEVDKQGQGFSQGEKGYPSNGRIAWALWGGDAGFSWSKKKRNQIEAEENKSDEKAEAGSLKVGDMVSWDSSGGRARGKITRIVRDGKLPIPNVDLTLNATEDNPACLIRVYQGGEPSDVIVGHRFATLRKV